MKIYKLTISYYSCIIFILFFSGCGRKQNNLFNFEIKKSHPYPRLKLPAAKLTSLIRKNKKITLCWLPPKDIPEGAILHGYALYRLSNNTLISFEPYKFFDVTQHRFNDVAKKYTSGYMMRGLYQVNGHCLQGSSSNILLLKKVPPT